MDITKIRLKDKLKVVQQQPLHIHTSCVLEKSNCSCGGKGYQIFVDGIYASADLCDCVKSCKACFGSMRLIEGDSSRPCKNPSPIKIVNILKGCQIPARFVDASLNNFKNNTGNCLSVIDSIKRWINAFKLKANTKNGLILSGPVGVGKTFILASVAKELAEKAVTVKFVDFHELLSVIRAGYSENKSDEVVIKPLVEADVLIIDELGKGRNNDWEQEKLDQLIMRRYNSNKPIVASTNYQLKEDDSRHNYNVDLENVFTDKNSFNPDIFGSLEQRVGKRIYSRLIETSNFIEIKGQDYRRISKLDKR